MSRWLKERVRWRGTGFRPARLSGLSGLNVTGLWKSFEDASKKRVVDFAVSHSGLASMCCQVLPLKILWTAAGVTS